MSDQKWTDAEIIRALKGTDAQRDAAWLHIRNHPDWWPGVLRMVLKYGGGDADAEDVFHEAVIRFDSNIRLDKFEGKRGASLKTYFLSTARNIWFDEYNKRLARQKREAKQVPEDDIRDPENELITKQQHDAALNLLAQISERCLKIMQLWAQGFSMTEIAEEVGLAGGADAAKKEKDRCRKRALLRLSGQPE